MLERSRVPARIILAGLSRTSSAKKNKVMLDLSTWIERLESQLSRLAGRILQARNQHILIEG